MSIQEARRAAFEPYTKKKLSLLSVGVVSEFWNGSGYTYSPFQSLWLDWNAALDSVCVVLPENCVYADPDGDYARGNRQGKRDYRNSIEAAGIRCEVAK